MILHNSARVAIHVTHRTWAVIALLAQLLLGIVMVKMSRPLSTAVAYNGLAAVLLASIINLNKVAWRAN
ncbi:MAG: hypothetical protein ACNA8J_01325 [Gammaproteobacteria bacterium]